jgi:putative hydrolase of the HAD superfamily
MQRRKPGEHPGSYDTDKLLLNLVLLGVNRISMEDTMVFFLPSSPSEYLKHVRSLAMGVFYNKADPMHGVGETLKKLSERNYSLAIISAGEEWVQKRRFEDFSLFDSFQVSKIVEHKTANEFRQICDEYSMDVSGAWMVGDSVRSDILPALEAGLNAVHIRSPNWSAEHDVIPEDVPSVQTLSEILAIILAC